MGGRSSGLAAGMGSVCVRVCVYMYMYMCVCLCVSMCVCDQWFVGMGERVHEQEAIG